MNDTEPMPKLATPVAAEPKLRPLERYAALAIACGTVALAFAIFFVAWTDHEFAMLRGEVREARAAAAAATRAADRATLAARAAQSALASNETANGTAATNGEQSPDPEPTPDSP